MHVRDPRPLLMEAARRPSPLAPFRVRSFRFQWPADGVPIGLLAAGPLVANYGYRFTASVYCLFGLVVTALIAVIWEAHIWRPEAAANRR